MSEQDDRVSAFIVVERHQPASDGTGTGSVAGDER